MDELKTRGVAVFRDVLGERDVVALREVVDGRTRTTLDGGDGQFWCESHLSIRSPAVRNILLGGPIPALVAKAMEVRRLWLYEDTVLVKEAGDAPGTEWHQDRVHYPARGSMATAWISLDDVNDHNGAVRYLPGSQAWGTLFEPVRFSDGKRFSGTGLTTMPDIDLAATISFSTRPGDMIVHDGLVIHGSPEWYIDRRRRALAVSYFGADVVYHETPFPYRHPKAAGTFKPTDCFQDLLDEVRLQQD